MQTHIARHIKISCPLLHYLLKSSRLPLEATFLKLKESSGQVIRNYFTFTPIHWGPAHGLPLAFCSPAFDIMGEIGSGQAPHEPALLRLTSSTCTVHLPCRPPCCHCQNILSPLFIYLFIYLFMYFLNRYRPPAALHIVSTFHDEWTNRNGPKR